MALEGRQWGGIRLSGVTSESNMDMQTHYAMAYSAAELRTFDCDRVRKMPLSGLDPSMLIGFLCKNEADWIDLRQRVTGVCGLFIDSFFFRGR